MDAYVIHLPHRTDRMKLIQQNHKLYPCLNLKVVEAVAHEDGLYGCLLSHQKIVRMAKAAGKPYVLVLEDDCRFLLPNGQLYAHLQHMVDYLARNPHVQVLNGCANFGEPQYLTWKSEGDLTFLHAKQIATTHCILYSARSYDTLLAFSQDQVIDVNMNDMRMEFVFPFLATQAPSYSDIQKEEVEHKIARTYAFVRDVLLANGR